ncbi:SseB protein N-terminal domain-containing protein [Tessaracoccus bendigoensis DSM 12906]|uniref:SseB protein N-terminal domain-containing protein n=1 Tax=Tessaracoccus bendigoensis DSM 12906 TaxID=1123357 RepID=A0A1M6KAK3_9ACTN|nr:SseB family protein [Tessaracoccus bendigoensis]SHJ55937.1 SseB protein N-terminal domain-containing protein [Tessaracoccus bendigoensis DSM 12906]
MPELRSLAQPGSRFAGDDGAPDAVTRQAIAKVCDHTSYIRAIVALCTSRLLMPIVATGDESMDGPDPERHAEMAAVTLNDESGSYLLAFTGIDSLKLWSGEARPIPCLLDELCATVQEAGAQQLLIDVAGPVPFVIAGDALQLLAEGNRLVEFEGEDFAWVKYADIVEP